LSQPEIQVATQFLTAGSGGIARCARLTVLALASEAQVSALAVEDRLSTVIGEVRSRAFGGNRSAFVAANMIGALKCDWVIYDFAGTARAHGPLGLAGRPYALWAHGLEVWPGHLRDDYARAIRGAKAVFVNSAHTRGRLAESLPGLSNVHECQLGTEADLAARPTPSASREDVLIAAWPAVVDEVVDAVLCFVGGGERLDRLRALAAASPAASSIRVMGPLAEADVERLHRRARLFAMLSRVEGFGLVFAEAMSHGAPVLTADEDASTEVSLDGETGLAVTRGDPGAVSRAIVSVLKDDRLFERLSRNAYARWSRRFCFSAFRARFLRVAAAAGLVPELAAPALELSEPG
jgi:phosphatidylinositol alpha-1,6-mannosyltransferase